MNVDGAFILAETRGKTSMLLFVDSIFINDSDEFGKMFVARIANVTEQLTSNCFSTDFSHALNPCATRFCRTV